MSVFKGRLSGANNAAAQSAAVRLTDMGLDIRPAEGRGRLWRYEDIRSSSSLHPGREVLIFSTLEPDARLLVDDPDFARELLGFAPQLSKGAARKRLFIPMFAATAVILLIIGYFWLSETSYSQKIARMIPHKTWDLLGEQVIGSITGNKKTCTSKQGLAVLDSLVRRLNQDASKKSFKVRVVDLDVINAFAAPGENIVISGHLIGFANSPDEVAGVLAHEMGHGIENHPEAGLVRALGISAAMNILLGGASDNIASIGSLLLQMSYSRKAEREADRHAVEILKHAAIDPQPLADFFRRLDKKKSAKTAKLARKALSVIGSHPAAKERIREIENTPDWPAKPALTPAEWKALQHICD